jgi:tRNA(Ile)-lysidine synthase TilS/MesJ
MRKDKIYNAILMLSGGKDSCALLYQLVASKHRVLCVTIDNTFLSDVAKRNIEKITNDLEVDHIYYKPKKETYQEIRDFSLSHNKGVDFTCSRCSLISFSYGCLLAKAFNVGTVYFGFTIDTAKSFGWEATPVQVVNGIRVVNPFYKEYALDKIIALMKTAGLEYNPVKTNCSLLEGLIKDTNNLSKDNHLLDEFNIHDSRGNIPSEIREELKAFVTAK